MSNTGQVIACSRGSVILSKTMFVNNSANESSLIMYLSPYFGNIRIEKSEFRGTVVSRGGAISLSGHSLVKECIFDNNHAIEGGALSIKGTKIKIVDYIFTKNVAVQNGGAIKVIYTSSYAYSSFILRLSNTSFTNNSAGWSGGALYIEGFDYYDDFVSVDSAVIIANNTAQKGGGICLHHSGISCSGFCSLMLLGNIASLGGGMYAEFSCIKIDFLQLNITNPYSTDRVLFFRNMAIKGGGLYLFNSTVSDYNLCAQRTLTMSSYYYNFITVKFIQNSA
jgi:predicted outer membrane repeat protein